LIIAFLLLLLLVWLVTGAVSALLRLPRGFRRRREARRRRAGEAALTRGLVALAAGDAAAAQLQAYRAEKLLDRSAMPLLLAAEAAERQGDRAAARRYFAALMEQEDTAFIGLRGLLAQALRDGDQKTALRLAERTRQLRPDVAWVTETLLTLQARAGEWEAARDTLGGASRRGVIPADRARHHRGVVFYELSRAAESRAALRQAAALAAKAQAQAPDIAVIACHHARLLSGLGRSRAAARAIERAWRLAPHPELAHAYLDLHTEAAPLECAAILQTLTAQTPDAVESHVVLAEAALAAQLWGEARRHLTAAGSGRRRLCLMMSRLEDAENSGRGREWLDRALGAPPDPCYVCAACANESTDWHSLCPRCGGFDTLSWRMPERAGGDPEARWAASVFPLMLPIPDAPLLETAVAKPPDRLGSGAAIR
jgi:HemY protein